MVSHLFSEMVESRNYQGRNNKPRIQQRILMTGQYSQQPSWTSNPSSEGLSQDGGRSSSPEQMQTKIKQHVVSVSTIGWYLYYTVPSGNLIIQ